MIVMIVGKLTMMVLALSVGMDVKKKISKIIDE